MPKEVEIYSTGLVHCSVCAPFEMPRAEVETEVNRQRPPGGTLSWKISNEDFSDGSLNGGEQHCSRGKTRHWLLVC